MVQWSNSCRAGKDVLQNNGKQMKCRADSRFAHSQLETLLQSNAVSRELGAKLESALKLIQ